MPTIVEERLLKSSSSTASSTQSLEAFTQHVLHQWLFTAGYGISKNVDKASDVKAGTIIDPNQGGILLQISQIDLKAGWIQYEMDPSSTFMGGPVLSAYRGEVQITEDTEDEQSFRVVWKVEYRLNCLLNILSLGIFQLSTRDMYRTLLRKDLERIAG